MRRTIGPIVAVAALGMSGCGGPDSPISIRVPQVERASEAIESGPERQRRYESCAGPTAPAAEVIPCMESGGYEFIPRDPTYPASECWSRREAKNAQLIGAFCFRKAGTGR